MPAVSKAQFRFFKMLENNPKMRKEKGISKETAKEYTSENKGKKGFSKLKEKIKGRK